MRRNERASDDAARHCTLWNRRFVQVIVGCSVLAFAQPLGAGAAAVATLAPELKAQAPAKDPSGRAIKLAAKATIALAACG